VKRVWSWFPLVVLWTCLALSPGRVLADDPINVLLITVDTFRPDRLSGYGHNRPTSPVLDSLAADGALFEQAFSSSSWTTPGLISVLTGLWAPTHAVDVRGKSLDPATPTMATTLADAGYATPDILYLSSIPNFQNLGLTDSYPERDRYLPNGDEVLFEALEAYRDSSFFLYYHYRNLHLPYNPSAPYDALYTQPGYNKDGFVDARVRVVRENVTIPDGSIQFESADSAWVRALYDGQVRQMDETFFRPLVRTLKRLNLYDNTLVIVTADHGEELLEHGFIGHPSTSFIASAYEEEIRIPLIMSCPALIPSRIRVKDQVQNVDILPTVLDLLGLPIPSSVQGRSLRPVFEGEAMAPRGVFTETTQGGYQSTPDMMKVRARAFREPPWKLIHTLGPGRDVYELYNLEQDPGEFVNLVEQEPGIVARMREELHAWVLSSTRVIDRASGSDVQHTGPIQVLYPLDQDTLRYVDADKTVDVRWSGQAGAGYVIEYDVGEGNYSLAGQIPVVGPMSSHGPFTEEMWNMLGLYNPYRFRVVADGGRGESSWHRFVILPTSSGTNPSWTNLLMTRVVWAKGEISLLAEGLWLCFGVFVDLVVSRPLVDYIGWGLAGLLLGGMFLGLLSDKFGRDRTVAWAWVATYSVGVYATLSVAPEIWGVAYRFTNGRVGHLITLSAIGTVLWAFLRIHSQSLGIRAVGVVVLLAGVYGVLLVELSRSPAERLHLLEYGLLSYLTYRACRLSFEQRTAAIVGAFVAALIGTGDEMIQWVLPNRVFEWKDVGLNVISSVLGMTLVLTLTKRGDSELE